MEHIFCLFLNNNTDIDPDIVKKLCYMFDDHKLTAKSFRMICDRLQDLNVSDLKLKLVSERFTDVRNI